MMSLPLPPAVLAIGTSTVVGRSRVPCSSALRAGPTAGVAANFMAPRPPARQGGRIATEPGAATAVGRGPLIGPGMNHGGDGTIANLVGPAEAVALESGTVWLAGCP